MITFVVSPTAADPDVSSLTVDHFWVCRHDLGTARKIAWHGGRDPDYAK